MTSRNMVAFQATKFLVGDIQASAPWPLHSHPQWWPSGSDGSTQPRNVCDFGSPQSSVSSAVPLPRGQGWSDMVRALNPTPNQTSFGPCREIVATSCTKSWAETLLISSMALEQTQTLRTRIRPKHDRQIVKVCPKTSWFDLQTLTWNAKKINSSHCSWNHQVTNLGSSRSECPSPPTRSPKGCCCPQNVGHLNHLGTTTVFPQRCRVELKCTNGHQHPETVDENQPNWYIMYRV